MDNFAFDFVLADVTSFGFPPPLSANDIIRTFFPSLPLGYSVSNFPPLQLEFVSRTLRTNYPKIN